MGDTLGRVDDELTFALALIGALTGTISAVSQAVQAWRERSRLFVDFGFRTAVGERPTAWIDVHNDAPRATTIREVGFYAKPMKFGCRGLTGRSRASAT